MEVYFNPSPLLPLLLESFTEITNLEESIKHSPQLSACGVRWPKLLYRPTAPLTWKEIAKALPPWGGELYIQQTIKGGGQFWPIDLRPYENAVRDWVGVLYKEECLDFLRKRWVHKYPMAHFRELLFLSHLGLELGRPLSLTEVQMYLDLDTELPSAHVIQIYAPILGTEEGARYLYSLPSQSLWPLIMGPTLRNLLENRPAKCLFLLMETRQKVEAGFPIREESVVLNNSIGLCLGVK